MISGLKDKDWPLISVIIRSMDRPELAKALESVAGQTYPNIEIILVNAKGRAHSAQNSWCGPFPIHFQSTGQALPRSRAANLGLQSTSGEFLIFLDDDDWFLAHHLQTLANVLNNNQNTGVAYAAVQCVKHTENGSLQEVYVFNQPFDRVRLFVENYLPIHASLFRKSLLENGCSFDESLDTYEDWDFWIQLARVTDFSFVDQIGAVYRIGPDSGFGLAGEEIKVDNALRIFFRKWRYKWTEDEFCKILEYAKYHSMYWDLRDFLTKVQEEKNRDMENLHSLINTAEYKIQGLIQERDALHADKAALLEQRDALHADKAALLEERQGLIQERNTLVEEKEQLILLVNSQSSDLDRISARVQELENSTSWKVTAPLRAVSGLLRTLGYNARLAMSSIRRLSFQAYQIWRAEGVRVLLYRLQDKISRFKTERARRSQKFSGPELDSAYHPLNFPWPEQPVVSIIIPAHNEYIYTFNCLKSILENTQDVAYEIILVDDCSNDESNELLQLMTGIEVITNNQQQGFVLSCNLGAAQARGKFLLFLNNDCLVTRGWLQSILELFAVDDQVGLVGAKLIYPDGTLQEAGGIVWRDGSAWNFGRGDTSDKPEYNYVRQVDYCSGACLAVSKGLFQALGGFDQDYAPAYFEDVDLAFKVKSRGLKVLYQPAAEVVHFEGVSTQKKMASGLKGYQVLHQERFYAKWKQMLQAHRSNGSSPSLEKDRHFRYRMLVLDKVMLTPDQDSGSLRMFNLLQELIKLEVKVVFATMYLEARQPYRHMLQQQGVEVIYPPHFYTVEQYLQLHGRDFDLIMMSRSDVAEFFMDMVQKQAPHALVIFDTVDLHFLREERMAQVHNSRSMARLAAQRKKTELALMQKSDIVLVVSAYEKELLKNECPDKKVEIISNIHDTYCRDKDFHEREGILFIGGFQHPPNTDAVLYLVQEILPLINEPLGEVKAYIIGSNPPQSLYKLSSEKIIVTGYVQDIAEYFNKVRLSVAPLRYGAGVKGKINLSMAYGVPVVASSVAVEGMYLEHGQNVMLGDDPRDFAQSLVQLYQDPILWEKISSNGLQNIEQHFSRSVARQAISNILQGRRAA